MQPSACAQLERLEQFVEERNRIAGWYETGLRALPEVSLCPVAAGQRHTYYKLPVRLPPGSDRNTLVSRLSDLQVPVGSCYWPPCHLTPFYDNNRECWRGGDFAVAEDVLPRTVTVPLYSGLTQTQVQSVVQALESAIESI